MNVDVNDTADPVAAYIRETPSVVVRTLAAVREQLASWEAVAGDRVVLVGAGTSFNALTVAANSFATDRHRVTVATPWSVLRDPTLMVSRPLVVGLSQTGSSASTVAALEHASAMHLDTVAMTADSQSAIVQHARRMLLLPVGPEPVGPKTKGYAASLAGLFAFSDWLARRSPRDVSAAELEHVLAGSGDAARTLAAELDDVDYIAIAGEDRHLGTAFEASLKIAEMSGVPTAAFAVEEMLHGRLHGLTARSLGILIAADAEQREACVRAANAMADHGVRIIVVNLTNAPTRHDWHFTVDWPSRPFDAIAVILPFQQLAAAMSLRRGRAPHLMPFPDLASRLGIKIGDAP